MAGQLFFLGLFSSIASLTTGDRIWNIGIGHEWGGHEYFDAKGYLQGFGLRFIDLVCSAGGMDCRIIRDKYENCWTHNQPGERPSGGVGLMSAWYDGCIGWVPTIERIHTMEFSVPYLKPQTVHFFVKNGDEGGFDPQDITGKNIGFLKGWAQNEQCLARQSGVTGRILKKEQIIIIEYPQEVLASLKDGSIDAYFGSDNTWNNQQKNDVYRFSDTEFSCFLGSNSLMARKDNSIISQWNSAFSKLKEGGKFQKYCQEANEKHKDVGTVPCIDN